MSLSAGAGTAIAGAISGAASAGGMIASGKMNKKTRKFNAEQAKLNREFNAQQAQMARDWSRQFYEDYQSPQAIIRQGKEAGLHPYAAMGINPASGPSAQSFPSGTAANAGQQFNPSDNLQAGIRSMLDLMGLKSQIDLNKSLANKYNAEAEGQSIENKFNPQLFEQQLRRGQVDIDNLKAGIERINVMNDLDRDQLLTNVVDRELKRANIKEVLSRADKIVLEQATERLKQDNIRQSTKNLAVECLKIQAERSLIAAQQVTESARSGLITAQVFKQKMDNIYYELYNHEPPKNFGAGLLNMLFNGAKRKFFGIQLSSLLD